MTRAELLDCLQHTVGDFYKGEIDEAITLHLELMLDDYQRKPFFYKSLLKYDRFMVVLSLFAFHYRDPLTPLSQVREFCLRRGYLSRNSLESYFSFFIITGYMHVSVHPEDARLRIYRPTRFAVEEAARLIKAYLLPGCLLTPGGGAYGRANDAATLLRRFFTGLVQFLDADILLDSLLPGAKWIMNKDGGHLPMLALYLDALRHRPANGGYKVSTYAELSSRLYVSRTHVMRLVREGETKGYFRCCGNTVEMRPMFAELGRHTMAINFAVARVSMELGADVKETEVFKPGAGRVG